MTPFTIRKATGADAPAIATLFGRVRRSALPYLPVLHSPEGDLVYFGGHVMETCTVMVAEAAETSGIAGFIAWRAGWVDHLYVEAGQHGRGIGTALLTLAMEAEFRLELWAFQKNTPTLAFYGRRGFRVVRETDGRDNEEKEPDVLLAWERGQSSGA